jgi:UDP-N-acetylmuramate dehydrogenase
VQADTLGDLTLLLNYCEQENIAHLVIGRGANLLVSDKGYAGLIVRLGRDFSHLKIDNSEALIVAGGAVSLARVIQEAYANSLEGLAFAAGIPATVGGAITSNAGAFGFNICDLISQIKVVDRNGLKAYERPFNTGYRKGPLNEGEILIEAVFQLKAGEKMAIKAKTESFFKKRKQSQPLDYPNAGSVFKNPSLEVSAGALIEKCGLKGRVYFSAMISEKHANFIINKGGAKAAHVYHLMKLIQERVRQEYNISLKPEIKLLGDFDEQEG